MKIWKPLAGVVLLATAGTLLAANGTKGKRVIYEARVPMRAADGAECIFAIELEPVLFPITSVQSKYRVIRINIRNRSSAALRLSLARDAVQALVGSRLVQGRLSLSDAEQAWWDALSADLRQALAYPDQTTVKAGEEENVFAFFPVADMPGIPDEVLFKVASFASTPIAIRRQNLTSKK